VTLAEALKIAEQAKPTRRLDKLSGSNSLAKHVSDVAVLAKSFDVMGGTLAKAQGQLNQIAADVEYIATFSPNSPIRRFHS
jgi:hypothetical protein